MNRVAVISATSEQSSLCQQGSNQVISSFQGAVKGRMGIPMPEENMAVISLVVASSTDEINSLTGCLGRLEHVTVKTSISKKEVSWMEQNQAPRPVSMHIALFGRRNAGKPSLINVPTGQNIVTVSDQRGTTADPVYKSIELFLLGSCVPVDTAGLDDTGELGVLRCEKSLEVLGRADIVAYVADAESDFAVEEEDFLQQLRQRGLPVILV